MSNDNNVGRVSLWTQADDVGKPAFKGTVEIRGEKLRVSLWPSDNKKENAPQYTGVVETEYDGD